jgi:hypothetical protein
MAAALIVRLTNERRTLFLERGEAFSEPVRDFEYSRNRPLIAFIADESGSMTHLARAKKGNTAGTDLRKLHLTEALELSRPVAVSEITDLIDARLRKWVTRAFEMGGLLTEKSFQGVVEALRTLLPETNGALSRFSRDREARLESLSENARVQLAEQKEAVLTAMAVAGIDRRVLQGWDSQGEVTSFLDGLEQVRLREDSMIINDLMEVPGFDEVKKTPYSSVVFRNDQAILTVVLANRLPLEKLTGTDLIYFNETFSCFLMVQYKAMEQEGSEALFRFPDAQLIAEIERMDRLGEVLSECDEDNEVDGFRLSDNPFFLKLCPRIVFDPDNVGLVQGMYLPLKYWKLLSEHPGTVGPKGGRAVSYRNVRRYLDNTSFVSIASGGWIGTTISQSKVLKEAIADTLRSGRAVVLAVKEELDDRHRMSSPIQNGVDQLLDEALADEPCTENEGETLRL